MEMHDLVVQQPRRLFCERVTVADGYYLLHELDQESDVYIDSGCAKDLGCIWLTISARYGWPA